MVAVAKITSHTNFTLTRESGDRLYMKIREYLDRNSSVSKIIFDFENVKDVSVSFIQATIVKLANEKHNVELINFNDAVRFKIARLIKLSNIDPHIFKKADYYPQSPVYV